MMRARARALTHAYKLATQMVYLLAHELVDTLVVYWNKFDRIEMIHIAASHTYQSHHDYLNDPIDDNEKWK